MPRSNVGQDTHVSPSLRKNLTSRVTLLRRLAGSGWGAGTTTLRTATLALVHSTAEYCTPAWCRNAHTRLTDSVINDALQHVTGCLRPTPVDNLPILAGIQPAEGALSQRSHTVSSTPCHGAIQNARHLKSRHPFVPAIQQLISSSDDDNNRSMALWADHRWNAKWLESTTRLRTFIPDIGTCQEQRGSGSTPSTPVSDISAPASTRVVCTPLSGMYPSAACKCGAEEQTVHRVVLHCPIHRPPHPHEAHGLTRQLIGCSTPYRDIVRPRSEVIQTMKRFHEKCSCVKLTRIAKDHFFFQIYPRSHH